RQKRRSLAHHSAQPGAIAIRGEVMSPASERRLERVLNDVASFLDRRAATTRHPQELEVDVLKQWRARGHGRKCTPVSFDDSSTRTTALRSRGRRPTSGGMAPSVPSLPAAARSLELELFSQNGHSQLGMFMSGQLRRELVDAPQQIRAQALHDDLLQARGAVLLLHLLAPRR